MMASVSREQRHLRNSPCPVCNGYDEMPRGQGKRCNGFTSGDAMWCHCAREELAGGISANDAGLYVHMMKGPCNCGMTHAERTDTHVVPEVVYPYLDEGGELLYEVVRKPGKKFLQRKPDGAGGHVWKLGDTRRVLYKLPELLGADVDAPVYVVEGEKDVATAERIGLVATCNPGGAGKWHMVKACAETALRDREVVIFRDADDVGRKHADQVAASLEGVARSVAIVEAPVGKDLTDYIETGADLEAVLSLADQRKPRTSSPDEPARAPLPANVVRIDDARSRVERQRDEDRARIVWGAQLDQDPGPTPWSSYALKIGPGRPTIICGEGGSRKSMFACYYSICVALGIKVLGRFDVEQGAGLYFDCEQGLALSRKRVRRFANGMGFSLADYNDRIAYIERPFNLDDEKVAPRLAELCRGFNVAIVDSVFRAASKLSQNDAEASIPMAVMARASSILGTTSFIGVDHASTKRDEKTQKRKAMQSGNHHKLDGSGTVYMLSAEKGKPTLVTCEREQTEGEYTEDFAFSVIDVPNPHLDEPMFGLTNESVESREHIAWRKWGLQIKEFGTEATEPTKKTRTDKPAVEPLRQIAIRILEAIKRQPGVTSGELEEAMKVATKRFGDALKILIADKLIENRTGKATRTEWVAK